MKEEGGRMKSEEGRARGRGGSRGPFILHPSSFILLASAFLLASCGWQLRGARELPFETVYVQGAETAPFTLQLKRAIRSSSQTRVVDKPEEAQVVLELRGETRDRQILSLTTGGRVAEFALNYRVDYRLMQKGREVIPLSRVSLTRSVLYNDTQVLARESEEALLYRDMQNDAVQQILRQLAAVKL